MNIIYKIFYLNKTPFTGKAFIINGYNGYTSSKDDGYVVDSKTRNPLKDKSENILKTTSHRGLTWKFTNGVKEKRQITL